MKIQNTKMKNELGSKISGRKDVGGSSEIFDNQISSLTRLKATLPRKQTSAIKWKYNSLRFLINMIFKMK